MIALSATARGEKQLAKLLNGKAKQINRQLAIAVNATSKKTVSLMAKGVGQELRTAQKNIKATIKIKQKADARAGKSPTAIVSQKKTGRIPLRDFGARQGKKGTSYRVSKTTGRGFVAGAFQGAKPGVMKASWRGRVFKRVGKERLPIVQLFGASPWGVFVGKKLRRPITRETRAELVKQINRRIRFLSLKKSGAI